MQQYMVYNFLFFIKVIVLFFIMSLVFTSHSFAIKAAAFFISQLKLIALKNVPISHSLISKHLHLHLSLFHFLLIVTNFFL